MAIDKTNLATVQKMWRREVEAAATYRQAIEIMKASGKPVYCIETNEMYRPGMAYSLKSNAVRKGFRLKQRLVDKTKLVLGKLVTPSSASKT